MGRRVVAVRGWVAAAIVALATSVAAAAAGAGAIKTPDLRDWLTYISSDELEGRAVFNSGFGLAAGFFTTGLHPDYYANTDEVSKIEFDKMTRITQMIYETGARIANLDHAPVRDHQGPRAGRLTQ